jgi:hypothetical protein
MESEKKKETANRVSQVRRSPLFVIVFAVFPSNQVTLRCRKAPHIIKTFLPIPVGVLRSAESEDVNNHL